VLWRHLLLYRRANRACRRVCWGRSAGMREHGGLFIRGQRPLLQGIILHRGKSRQRRYRASMRSATYLHPCRQRRSCSGLFSAGCAMRTERLHRQFMVRTAHPTVPVRTPVRGRGPLLQVVHEVRSDPASSLPEKRGIKYSLLNNQPCIFC
jgi:hypothetical protein